MSKPGTWKPGQSGNPGGRARTPQELKEAFKALAPKAVAVLASLLKDEGTDPRLRLRAAEVVIERVMGKVPSVEDIPTGDEVTGVDLVRIRVVKDPIEAQLAGAREMLGRLLGRPVSDDDLTRGTVVPEEEAHGH